MLIRRIEKFSTDTDLAIGFTFIENETDIEVSINKNTWIPLEIYNTKTQIHIFQGFKELDIAKVYYRYKLNDEIIEKESNIRTNFKHNPHPDFDFTIPEDFKIRNKGGAVFVNAPIETGDN